uniref:Coiled-coil domain containing 30 n=1 Tax=Labrus bergylta TaxID=56723 RepID=A0A3Q3GD19_9LABR
DGGIPLGTSAEERQGHPCQKLLDSEAKLQTATRELQTLRTQQAKEMLEVESYVAHIRGLLEERECLTADYERDNEHLRQELHQIRQRQESQSKELAEMLAQEDLGEIGLSSPSEQVAYLLVERATLLERLEAVERRLESQSLTENLREVHQQQSPWKKLFGLRRSGQSKHNITPAHSEEISQEKNEHQRLERDLEEASRRLAMAHQDIRRLTNEVDAAKNNLDPSSELQGTVQEVENLRKEVDKLKHCDMMKLQRAKEQNDKLDAENRALRERVLTLDSEKKCLLDQCREAMEDGVVQLKEMQRQLQRLHKQQEELEERNEELEALLGEAQNSSKEERHRHEGELEGLHRREKKAKSFFPGPKLRDSSQERLALLEARLTEEKDWRKQLEVDLSAAQAALKKDKEALQISERELKKLRLEVNSLQRECQQGKTLIKSLTQVKGEKAVLEEKVAQMERSQSRLQSKLEYCKDSNRTQEDKLQEQADGLIAELISLQTAHNALFSRLKQELNLLQTKLEKECQLASQHQLALQAQVNEAQAHIKDLVLNQKAEEAKQMKQDLQRAQSLFSSAERELRYEKEKNLDLKRHNTLLDQEKLKLCAELKQVQKKLVQMEHSVQAQAAECECQQQKIRKLELELARNSTNRSTTTSLQEELQAERVRLMAADKKVLELQQQLKNAQHQLRVEEARAGESSRLERDSRDLADTISALRTKQQEEHITKLLEQREEELQQQLRSLRLKEASMTKTNAELSHRAQQLESHLTILEAELRKAREEVRDNQRSYNKLQEDLGSKQQEVDRLQGELQQVLLQLDTHVRKYNEKQSQHKTKLRQAKQVFLKATAQKDRIIQKLENDLVLASSLSHKQEKERINTVMEENEKLLEEKRELLRNISEAEEMGSKGMRTASTVQYVNVLEMENRQLQDRTLKLSNQVSSLERALRNVQSHYSVELTSGSCDPLHILDAICHVKVGECVVADSTAAVSMQQPSEQGYLNLISP